MNHRCDKMSQTIIEDCRSTKRNHLDCGSWQRLVKIDNQTRKKMHILENNTFLVFLVKILNSIKRNRNRLTILFLASAKWLGTTTLTKVNGRQQFNTGRVSSFECMKSACSDDCVIDHLQHDTLPLRTWLKDYDQKTV